MLFVAAALAMTASVPVIDHLREVQRVSDLTKDPLSLAGLPFYYGYLSQLGVMVWFATAANCFFCAALLTQPGPSTAGRDTSLFFTASGGFTLLLVLDDVFLLHERALPDHLGVPETFVYLTYVLIAGAYVLRFSPHLKRTRPALFATSLLLFATSLVIDQWIPDLGYRTFFEDGPKFLGICCWALYFFAAGYDAIRPRLVVHDITTAPLAEEPHLRGRQALAETQRVRWRKKSR